MTKSSFKLFSALMFLILILSLITGCSSAENESASTDGEEGVTLTYLIDNQASTAGIEAVAAEIGKRYNIKTEFEIRPGGAEGDNLVKTRLATGEMTDLMGYNSGSLFKALNPQEYFVDLSNESFIEKVEESYIETVSVADKVYGIPSSSAVAGGFLFNKKVYEELGLSVPKTWNELMENNEKIKAAGKVPVVAAYKDSWTSQVVLLADYYNVQSKLPNFSTDYTNNKAGFANTPIALRGFEKIAEIQEAGHMNEEAAVTTLNDALAMLASGEAAQFPILSFVLPTIAENHPNEIDDIGFFPIPGESAEDNGITLWLSGGIYINKESEHIEEAKQWMEFFVSPEGMEIYMENQKAYGPYLIKGIELPDDPYTAVKDMMPYVESGKVSPSLEFLSPIKGPNLPQITVEVGLGMISAQEGAEKYDSDVRKQAVQLGLEGWE